MMGVLKNHCWCSDSNWGGQYNCRVIVSIERIADGKHYHDPPTEDWTNLIERVELKWEKIGDAYSTYRLKSEVMKWLEDNIANRKTSKYETNPKGWAVGTDQYNTNSGISFNLFFESVWQARKFIKRWSSIGKPNDYLNYFEDKRYKYNPKTKTLQRIQR